MYREVLYEPPTDSNETTASGRSNAVSESQLPLRVYAPASTVQQPAQQPSSLMSYLPSFLTHLYDKPPPAAALPPYVPATGGPGSGALAGVVVGSTYPPLEPLQQKRLAARRHNVTYVYDFPAVFEAALRDIWAARAAAGAANICIPGAAPWQAMCKCPSSCSAPCRGERVPTHHSTVCAVRYSHRRAQLRAPLGQAGGGAGAGAAAAAPCPGRTPTRTHRKQQQQQRQGPAAPRGGHCGRSPQRRRRGGWRRRRDGDRAMLGLPQPAAAAARAGGTAGGWRQRLRHGGVGAAPAHARVPTGASTL